MSLQTIEKTATEYSDVRRELSGAIEKVQMKMDITRRNAMPGIRRLTDRAKRLHEKLHAAVEAEPELFKKPRTYTWAGIKVGFQKGKGKIEYGDLDTVIAKIEKLYPKEQAKLLVKVKKTLIKKGVQALSVEQLQKLGITVKATGDAVVITATDDALDKAVAALLDEGAKKPDDGDEEE